MQGEQTLLGDGGLKGFVVRAVNSGLKTFILQYRDADARTHHIKLGRFGAKAIWNYSEPAECRADLPLSTLLASMAAHILLATAAAAAFTGSLARWAWCCVV